MQLEELTLVQLVELYNKHAEKPVTKFKDKPTALRRTLQVLPAVQAPVNTRRALPFNLPPKEERRTMRKGTKRARVVEMLSVGATIDEVAKDLSWSHAAAREAILILHKYCGFGLVEDGSGQIKLVL